MPLGSRQNHILISDTSLRDGNWHWLDETPGISADGWDTLTVRYVKHSHVFLTVESGGVDFPTGQKIGTRPVTGGDPVSHAGDFPNGLPLPPRNFWVQGISGPVCKGGLLYEVTVTYKGLAATQPVVITWDNAANQQSGKNISVSNTVYANVSTQENHPTLNARYISLDTSAVPTNKVSRARAPSLIPGVTAAQVQAVPTTVWDYLTTYVYHWPNGWVLMNANVAHLPGTTVGLVSENYQYIHEQSPSPA